MIDGDDRDGDKCERAWMARHEVRPSLPGTAHDDGPGTIRREFATLPAAQHALPQKPSSAGSNVSEASMVIKTASDAAIATPFKNESPQDEHAQQRDTHRRAGEEHRATRGVDRRTTASSTVKPRFNPCRDLVTMKRA